jgi:formiminotetrahydrofolate cyclodeaminase
LIKKLTDLIDEDTEAFNDVIAAFKMPKETDDQKSKRSNAIQEGYKTASKIPLETAKTCMQILDVAKIVAEKGNKNSITDAGVSALMARSGVESAILNVKINLGSIKDKSFVDKTIKEIENFHNQTSEKVEYIIKLVSKNL